MNKEQGISNIEVMQPFPARDSWRYEPRQKVLAGTQAAIPAMPTLLNFNSAMLIEGC